MKPQKLFFKISLWLVSTFFVVTLILSTFLYIYYQRHIPDIEVLKNVQLQVPLRLYTRDGKLLAEYGKKKRMPVRIDDVPDQLIQAILATEDRRFFDHPGVDIIGLLRATRTLMVKGTKSEGGSTITMQVARNFFLSRKKTFRRKFNEILLAIKIERELSKMKILELYLNKIYLGNRAYGVAAAAQVYYGQSLQALTLAQVAMIAGLPKAPSKLNPLTNPQAALARRNHVLKRMLNAGFINKATFLQTIKVPITARFHRLKLDLYAPYLAEMVRRTLLSSYGEKAYTNGYKVYTTIDSKLQLAGQRALQHTVISYDRRHGFRGSLANWGAPESAKLSQWQQQLQSFPSIAELEAAVVVDITEQSAFVLRANGSIIQLSWSGLKWARFQLDAKHLGPKPQQASDILKSGDVVYVQRHETAWELGQLPKVEGALVAMNPHDGAIITWIGGFNFSQSHFDRIDSSERQVGSNIKPFLYSAALAKGFTLASIINDAPVVTDDPGKHTLWRPHNNNRRFYGPTRLRTGLIKSRNLVSIRLLQHIGIEYARRFIARFGFKASNLPSTLSLALGASIATPLELVTGYAVFANGGYKVTPYVIDKIVNSAGKVVYQAKPDLLPQPADNPAEHEVEPSNTAARAITMQNAYLITSALRDVIVHGTGRRALILKRGDLAGKTGSTNEQIDAWFSGFNSDIAVTTWMGFDQPRSLGEYAAQTALPMWIAFIRYALQNKPAHTMPQPPDLITLRIDPHTGEPATGQQRDAIFELFRTKFAPHKSTDYASTNNNPNQTSKNTSQVMEELF